MLTFWEEEADRQWKEHRPTQVQYLKKKDVYRPALELAKDRFLTMADDLIRDGMDAIQAHSEAKAVHLLLPTLEEMPVLHPDLAPFGQPEAAAELETEADHQWNEARPTHVRFLKRNGVYEQALQRAAGCVVKMADNLRRHGMYSIQAYSEIKTRYLFLPTLDDEPVLGPDLAPFGQPDEDETAVLEAAMLEGTNSDSENRLDPEIMQDGFHLAAFHFEAGVRSFADFSAAMIGELGEAARPFLRMWYESIRHYPGFDNTGMTPASEIDACEQPKDAKEHTAEPEGLI